MSGHSYNVVYCEEDGTFKEFSFQAKTKEDLVERFLIYWQQLKTMPLLFKFERVIEEKKPRSLPVRSGQLLYPGSMRERKKNKVPNFNPATGKQTMVTIPNTEQEVAVSPSLIIARKLHEEEVKRQFKLKAEEKKSLELAMDIMRGEEQRVRKEKENARLQQERISLQLAQQLADEEKDRMMALRIMKESQEKENLLLTKMIVQQETFGFDPNQTTDCGICMEKQKNQDMQPLNCCDSLFCRTCLHKYFEMKIGSNELPIKCPNRCGKEVPHMIIQNLVFAESFEKMLKFSLNNFVSLNQESYSCCMTPGCDYMFAYESHENHFQCLKCSKGYCLQCKCEWHQNVTCEKYQQWLKENGEGDDRFDKFVKGAKLKQCAKCKHWIQRTEGCNHMTCRCKYQFCYVCGKK